MGKTGCEWEENGTGNPSPDEGKMVKPDVIKSGEERNDTSRASPKKGRSVPSTAAEGSIWLQYAPREPKTEETISST